MQATLGKKYRDKITGVEGIATARCEYLSGQIDVLLESERKGEVQRNWIDEARLEEAE